MKLPFTVDQFLEVFKTYNESVFPMQIIFYLLSAIVVYLTIKPTRISGKIISGILSFFWLWMGIVYHIIFFTVINNTAYLFGGLFIIQGILFLLFGVFQNKFSFQFQKDIYGITGIVLILFALIIYPYLGYFYGHFYPTSPTFGLPCPTTIFTFGLLLMNRNKCSATIHILPLAWSIAGFMAALQLGMLEDTGLIVAGLVTISLLIYRNETLKKVRINSY